MIKSITFKEVGSVKLPDSVEAGYEFSIPALEGRTFTFKPGPNIIIGENGSGKSTLLNVIRGLTFCKRQFGSDVKGMGRSWIGQISIMYEKGYWHLTEMKGQYKWSVINLRKSEDIESDRATDNLLNLVQVYESGSRSHGQNQMNSLYRMMDYIKGGGELVKDIKDSSHLKFEEMVLKPIEQYTGRDIGGCMLEDIVQYYKDNIINTTVDTEYNGLTILEDEPDMGLDINNIENLYRFLVNAPNGYQHIAVLHNIGIIHKLMEHGGVNFIELTEGYLDKVERFFR